MTFSDDDLRRFKKYLKSLGKCSHSTDLNCVREDGLSLIARLGAAEKVASQAFVGVDLDDWKAWLALRGKTEEEWESEQHD